MVIYEVNLDIQDAIADEYLSWLKQHVNDIIAFQGFDSYTIYKVEDNNTKNKKFTVQYQVDSRESLQHYLDNHASVMRAEAVEKFGDQFSANRRIMQTI